MSDWAQAMERIGFIVFAVVVFAAVRGTVEFTGIAPSNYEVQRAINHLEIYSDEKN